MQFNRFSIRLGLALMTAAALFFSWFNANRNAVRSEIEAVSKFGEVALVDKESDTFLCATGLRGIAEREPTNFATRIASWISPNAFNRITSLSVWQDDHVDSALHLAESFHCLKALEIPSESVTPEGLARFRRRRPDVRIMLVKPESSGLMLPEDTSPFGEISN